MVRASQYGVLADMEDLQRLLGNTVSEYNILRDTLQEVRANNDVRAERNVIIDFHCDLKYHFVNLIFKDKLNIVIQSGTRTCRNKNIS